MKYDFHVHDALRVEYRVLANRPSLAPDCARIERETRCAGGNGVVAACALAKWGARVWLTGNPIGADAHGQFLRRELQKVPNLTFEADLQADFETPYAILIQTAAPAVTTLLSQRAALLQLERRLPSEEASHFLGANMEEIQHGATFELNPSTQSYEALCGSLHNAALAFHGWSVALRSSSDFASEVVQQYKAAFDGPNAIPGSEEIEALKRAKR